MVWDVPSTIDGTKVRSLDLLISKAQPGPESEGPTGEASYQLDARWHQRNQACIFLSGKDASREYMGLFVYFLITNIEKIFSSCFYMYILTV